MHACTCLYVDEGVVYVILTRITHAFLSNAVLQLLFMMDVQMRERH